MKFAELKSIGHNIADSLGSGIGIMIGFYETDIYGEAARSADRYVLIDFLNGKSSGAPISQNLAKAISLYSQSLRELCKRHGTSVGAFAELTVRYTADAHGRRFFVTVVDRSGRRSTDEYQGRPGKRAKELDALGRIRPKPSLLSWEATAVDQQKSPR
jgi:hypothetical protein